VAGVDREVGDGGAIDDVEALLGEGPEEMAGEADSLPDAPLPVAAIERKRPANAVVENVAVLYPGQALPVLPRDEMDLVSGGQAAAQFAVALFGTPCGEGVQRIVD